MAACVRQDLSNTFFVSALMNKERILNEDVSICRSRAS